MIKSPRVSVIIPTYNHARFISTALRSVLAQTVSDWECYIVNNFSEDDTEDVVASINDPRIRLINFRNNGIISASRNYGIKHASGEWIAFLDSDDSWYPRKLEASLAAGNGADVVGTAVSVERGDTVVRIQRSGPERKARFRSLLYNGSCLTPSATMVRKTALLAVGGFDEDAVLTTGEDLDLWLKLARGGFRFRFIDEVLAHYRLHDANASLSIQRHLAAAFAVINRHYYSIKEKSMLDAILYRRACARALYSAGRTAQQSRQWGDALAYFVKSLKEFPFMPRLYVAMAAVMIGDVKHIGSKSSPHNDKL